jgi:hypothetical protein
MVNPGIQNLPRFTIDIADEQLEDLSRRLKDTRWPEDIGNTDWFYGVNGAYLKELVQYWIEGFDWRAAERQLNAFANFRVVVDDVPIHFFHVPGKGPAPLRSF